MNNMNDLNRLYKAKMQHHKATIHQSELRRFAHQNDEQHQQDKISYLIFSKPRLGSLAAALLSTVLVVIWLVA